MIDRVTFQKTTYAELPFKFEAGLTHIAGIIALGGSAVWTTSTGSGSTRSRRTKTTCSNTRRRNSAR